MFKKLSYLIYVFILTFTIFGVIIFLTKNNVFLDKKVIYVYGFLLFPFLDKLLDNIKFDLNKSNFSLNYGMNYYKYLFILIVSILSYFYGIDFNKYIFYLFISILVLFRLDSRFSFLIALSLLLFTPLYLLLGDKNIAENLSIYTYYFLIIGVIIEILGNLFKDEQLDKINNYNNKNILSNTYFHISKNILYYLNKLKNITYNYKVKVLTEIGEEKILETKIEEKKEKNNSIIIKLIKYFFNKFKLNIRNIVYFFYSLFGILVLLNFNYEILFILKGILLLFIALYIFSKILNIDYLKKEINLKLIINTKYFLNIAILFLSIGLIEGYILLKYMKIPENNYILVLIGLLFLSIFYLFFYNINKREIFYEKSSKVKQNIKYINKNILYLIFNLIKNNIYKFLNLLVIIIILILITFKYEDIIKMDVNQKNYTNIIKDKKIEKILEKEKKYYDNLDKNKLIENLKIGLISDEVKINEDKTEKIGVKQYYTFKTRLEEGSKNYEVQKLEEIMKKLGYFNGEPDKVFDLKTKDSLIQLLKKECDWPDSTKGILGPKAQLCLYSLKINK